jgi:hypothetical protein
MVQFQGLSQSPPPQNGQKFSAPCRNHLDMPWRRRRVAAEENERLQRDTTIGYCDFREACSTLQAEFAAARPTILPTRRASERAAEASSVLRASRKRFWVL